MKRQLLLAVAVLLGTLAYAAPAVADDRPCTGTIGAVSIDDNVVVPGGASCRLEGTRIEGNVIVRSNSTLTALGVRVGGNVQAERHRGVSVSPRSTVRSFVDGDIQLEDGGRGRVIRTDIEGNLQVEDASAFQEAIGNVIDGDLQAFDNRGGFEITSNRIDGNLQCKGNEPPPYGGGNTVEGDSEDQCESLPSRPPSGEPSPSPPPGGERPATAGPTLAIGVVGGRQLRRVTRVAVRCDVACALRAVGAVVLRGPANRVAMRLRPNGARLAAGQRGVLGLALSPRRARVAYRAIRSRRVVATLVLRARAVDAARRTSVVRMTVGRLRTR